MRASCSANEQRENFGFTGKDETRAFFSLYICMLQKSSWGQSSFCVWKPLDEELQHESYGLNPSRMVVVQPGQKIASSKEIPASPVSRWSFIVDFKLTYNETESWMKNLEPKLNRSTTKLKQERFRNKTNADMNHLITKLL